MLDASEMVELSPQALALYMQIRDAIDPEGPEGRKVTREERRELIANAAAFLAQLTRDALD